MFTRKSKKSIPFSSNFDLQGVRTCSLACASIGSIPYSPILFINSINIRNEQISDEIIVVALISFHSHSTFLFFYFSTPNRFSTYFYRYFLLLISLSFFVSPLIIKSKVHSERFIGYSCNVSRLGFNVVGSISLENRISRLNILRIRLSRSQLSLREMFMCVGWSHFDLPFRRESKIVMLIFSTKYYFALHSNICPFP